VLVAPSSSDPVGALSNAGGELRAKPRMFRARTAMHSMSLIMLAGDFEASAKKSV